MPKSTRILFVITHTETYYNRNRIFTGQANSYLTPRGHRQAEGLAKRLRREKLDLAFISPLERTRQTLNHILKYHPGLEVRIDPRITERDYGMLSHKSKIKYRLGHPDLYQLYHRSYEVPPPGGENMIQVSKRVMSFLKDVIFLIKRKKINVLVVVHNNSIRPIRRYFEKMTPEEMMQQDNYNRIFKYKIQI
jgi:broad specificity phosphatase PhoE